MTNWMFPPEFYAPAPKLITVTLLHAKAAKKLSDWKVAKLVMK